VRSIGRGPDNAVLAKKLGASVDIDSAATNAAAELQKLGGARAILATAPSAKAMSSIFGRKSIQDTLRFAELTGVRPMIETYPLARANEAYARMLSGKAQFRVVLTM